MQGRAPTPSLMSTVQPPAPLVAAVLLILDEQRTRRGVDSPANPTFMLEEPSSTTIVWLWIDIWMLWQRRSVWREGGGRREWEEE